MNVLVVSQIPVENGGRGAYTTGVANVVDQLAKNYPSSSPATVLATNLHASAQSGVIKKSGYEVFGLSLRRVFRFLSFSDFSRCIFIWRKTGMSLWRLVVYIANIRFLLQRRNIQIIHVHNVLFAGLLRSDIDVPVLLTLHGNFYRSETAMRFNAKKGINLKRLYEISMPYVRSISFLTEAMKLEVENDFCLSAPVCEVISNGVDDGRFYFDHVARDEVRALLGMEEDCIAFVTVGSLQQRKGQLRFLKCLAATEESWSYLMIGSGPDEALIEAEVSSLGLMERVRHIPFVDNKELYRYLSACDVYAHVSTEEGQALSVLEARATGLPAIVASEIWETMGAFADQHVVCFNFANDAVGQLTSVCSDLPVAGSDRAEIASVTSWASISEKYVRLYERVTEKLGTQRSGGSITDAL